METSEPHPLSILQEDQEEIGDDQPPERSKFKHITLKTITYSYFIGQLTVFNGYVEHSMEILVDEILIDTPIIDIHHYLHVPHHIMISQHH